MGERERRGWLRLCGRRKELKWGEEGSGEERSRAGFKGSGKGE